MSMTSSRVSRCPSTSAVRNPPIRSSRGLGLRGATVELGVEVLDELRPRRLLVLDVGRPDDAVLHPQQERHVVEGQAELTQEDLARQRLAERGEEVDGTVGGERVDQCLREVPDHRFETGDLPGGEQWVEQLAVLGVLLPVEHQRNEWPARAQRHRHDRHCVGIDRVDIATLGDRDDVVEARELDRVSLFGQRSTAVDRGDALVGVRHAVDERALVVTSGAIVDRVLVCRHCSSFAGDEPRPLE